MTDWAAIFLGVIAASTLVMALIQIGMVIAGLVVMKKVNTLTQRVEREIEPVAAYVNSIVHQVQEGVAAATERVHRFEDSLVRIAGRVDQTVGTVQAGLMTPAREGAAIAAGARAVVRALREPRSPRVQ